MIVPGGHLCSPQGVVIGCHGSGIGAVGIGPYGAHGLNGSGASTTPRADLSCRSNSKASACVRPCVALPMVTVMDAVAVGVFMGLDEIEGQESNPPARRLPLIEGA